jgi:hypothetical protein
MILGLSANTCFNAFPVTGSGGNYAILVSIAHLSSVGRVTTCAFVGIAGAAGKTIGHYTCILAVATEFTS